LASSRSAGRPRSQQIDPWHLAVVLEGLRLCMDPTSRIIDRDTWRSTGLSN
jgi:hypothetical protein